MTATLNEPVTPRFHDPRAHAQTQETQILLEEAAFMRGVCRMPLHKIAERLGLLETSLARSIERHRAAGGYFPE